MGRTFMTVLYNLLQVIGLVCLFPVWLVLLLMNERLRKGLAERMGFSEAFKDSLNGPSLWVHAASLGEVKVSAPICETLAEKFPSREMIFSASTPVGKKQARVQIKGAKRVFLLPLDFLWVVCRVVKRFRPEFFLVAETELWPNLFFCLKRRGTRIALFNGRISDRSFRRYRMFRFFFRQVLSCVDLFLVQTEMDASRLAALGAVRERIQVTGNVKFDAAYVPLESHEKGEIREMLNLKDEDVVWVAGSVHPEEISPIIDTYKELVKSSPRLKLILIPRHLYAMSQFEESLRSFGLSYAKWNGRDEVAEPWSILLVNALGQLVRLYQLGFAAFVGGSLAPIGGHNPLEPLRYGIPTLFGPRMENFREIKEIAVKEEVAFEVSDTAGMTDLLKRLLERPEWRREIRERCSRMFERYRGATRRSVEYLEAWIRKNS